MLIFDQLQKNDQQLRLLAYVVLLGICVLLAGLWWTQIVSYSDFKAHLETQSFRTVRIPAARGKLLDRNGNALAASQPDYSVSIYLEDLRKQFNSVYSTNATLVKNELSVRAAAEVKRLGRKLTPEERRPFLFSSLIRSNLFVNARVQVVNGIVERLSRAFREPITFDVNNFIRHYRTRLALPYPLIPNLSPTQLARFAEAEKPPGVELETQAERVYPYKTMAAHLLGHLKSEDKSQDGEDPTFDYRLPDFAGTVGLEYAFDTSLRGHAGAKSVLVNNVGFRQTENFWSPVEPGSNVVLTIDVRIQQAAEEALRASAGADRSGAVVVMDVRSGDILALTSWPSFDPNDYVKGYSQAEYAKMQASGAEHNRATGENLIPGSIFKPIVGLACLEAGMDPQATIYNPPNPNEPGRGHIMIGRRSIKDTAPPGDYDFRRAILRSSNTYFITNGMRYAGIERIVSLGRKFHLGNTNRLLNTLQETPGMFPTLERVQSRNWRDGDTANVCFGQGEVAVSPLQMAVAYSAIANGGKVLWPRIVDRIEPFDPLTGGSIVFEKGRVRDEIGVSARNLKVLQDAMLAETEDPEGTGKSARIAGFPICGKTGTAQVQDSANRPIGWNYWFASFAPYDSPRYAVIVMVESKENIGSGGSVCAPVAHRIYSELIKTERTASTLAQRN